MKSGKFTAA